MVILNKNKGFIYVDLFLGMTIILSSLFVLGRINYHGLTNLKNIISREYAIQNANLDMEKAINYYRTDDKQINKIKDFEVREENLGGRMVTVGIKSFKDSRNNVYVYKTILSKYHRGYTHEPKT